MTLAEIESELNRLNFKLTFDNAIINRIGGITNVVVSVKKERLRFTDESGNLLVSYPAKIENVKRFLNEYWYAGV